MILSIALCLSSVISIHAAAPNVFARYIMDDITGTTIPDSSGQNNNGVMQNGAAKNTNLKKEGSASLCFGATAGAGGNSRANLGRVDFPARGGYCSMWVWFASLNIDSRLVAKATGSAANDAHFQIRMDGGAGANNKLTFRLKVNGNTQTHVVQNHLPPLDTWVHYTVGYNGVQVKAWVDSVERFSLDRAGSYTPNANVDLVLGNQPAQANDNRGLDGCIDNFFMFTVDAAGQELTTADTMRLMMPVMTTMPPTTLPAPTTTTTTPTTTTPTTTTVAPTTPTTTTTIITTTVTPTTPTTTVAPTTTTTTTTMPTTTPPTTTVATTAATVVSTSTVASTASASVTSAASAAGATTLSKDAPCSSFRSCTDCLNEDLHVATCRFCANGCQGPSTCASPFLRTGDEAACSTFQTVGASTTGGATTTASDMTVSNSDNAQTTNSGTTSDATNAASSTTNNEDQQTTTTTTAAAAVETTTEQNTKSDNSRDLQVDPSEDDGLGLIYIVLIAAGGCMCLMLIAVIVVCVLCGGDDDDDEGYELDYQDEFNASTYFDDVNMSTRDDTAPEDVYAALPPSAGGSVSSGCSTTGF